MSLPNVEDETPRLSEIIPTTLPTESDPVALSYSYSIFDAEPPTIDLRALEYTNHIDENLVCPVCRVALVDPITTSCDHVFCRECFEQSYEIAKLCPIDRTRLVVPHDIGPTHRLILNQLDSLEVRCPNKVDGCTKILPRSMVQNHVQKYCDYATVRCKDPECVREVPRKDIDRGCLHKSVHCPDCHLSMWELHLESHRRLACEERKVDCELCGLEILRVEFDDHGAECEEAWAPCRWAVYGCSYTSKRKDLPEHRPNCHFELTGPVLDSLKGEILGLRSEIQFLNEKDRVKDRRLRFLECTRSALSSDNNSPQNIMDIANLPDAPATADYGPYDSRDQYMLSLLEHQESQVDRLSAGLTELEAKQTMMLFNETLPIKEQLAEIRSTQSTLGMHVRWLMQFRMKDSRASAKTTTSGSVGSAAGSASAAAAQIGSAMGPIRRLSETMRENITKL